jgi:hypothetical protein
VDGSAGPLPIERRRGLKTDAGPGTIIAVTSTPIRRLWQLAEPIHSTTYFAPEAAQAFADAGLRGFWRGYFAGRAAPLGPVGPGVVTAVFFGFAPSFVERAIPSIWSMIDIQRALETRLAGVDAALPALLGGAGDDGAVGLAVNEARRAMDRASTAGRPLFAANLDLSWPDPPHLALWHATTLLREHRGDGHTAALTAAGLEPCEAHVTQVAARRAPLDTIAPYRGWEEADWMAAEERLRSRGWLDGEGGLTATGAAERQAIEDATDRLALQPWADDGDGLARLVESLEPLTAAVVAKGHFPYPNPIGVPPPHR